MSIRRAIFAVILLVQALPAQSGDSVHIETLAPGVRHTRIVRLDGPETINVLTLDLHGGATLRHVRALGEFRGREKTSAMAARARASGADVLAAVNADFFSLKSGENENNEIVDGEWWKGLAVTDAPSDSAATVHSQFALDSLRRPLMDQFVFDGEAFTAHDTIPLAALNGVPRAANSAALFTWRAGSPVLGDSVRTSVEVRLAALGTRGDTALYVRSPSDRGAILAGYEGMARRVGLIRAHDTIRVVLRTRPRTAPLALLVGGWPRLLRDGVDVTGDAGHAEGTVGHIANARNPRTAIGFSRDSSTLYFVTVDGRSKASAGMTAAELAAFMREFGSYQALNLDGGGSTTMVVHDRVVNAPSDSTGERAVGDALLLVARKKEGAPLQPMLPELDSARLMRDIGVLSADSMEGRRIGTPGSARARAFILREFAQIGLVPVRDSFAMPFNVSARVAKPPGGVNLAGMIGGTKHPNRYLVVSAHYDHLGVRSGAIYNGADDNASGTAAVLEMARWFKAHPPENSMIFALFDGEEEGLLGAKAFVAHPPVPLERIAADVNLDMVSRNEHGELYASGASATPALRPLLDSVAKIAAVKLLLGHDTGIGESNWIQQSDQGAFADRKVPFVYFGVEDHADYHKPSDKVAHIQPGFFYRSAETIAEYVRRLDRETATAAPARAPDE